MLSKKDGKNPKNWASTHVGIRGWAKKYARLILYSSMDYGYRNHDEVLCNGCFEDMRPNNCFMVQYSDNEIDWENYDVYCFDCKDRWFSEASIVKSENRGDPVIN